MVSLQGQGELTGLESVYRVGDSLEGWVSLQGPGQFTGSGSLYRAR